MYRYIKQLDGKWYDVYVEFDENGVGYVVDAIVTDEMPEIDETDIVYARQ